MDGCQAIRIFRVEKLTHKKMALGNPKMIELMKYHVDIDML